MKRPVKIVDLFCGAGGTSTGALRACSDLGRRASLTAINHWERAVETHSQNHPDAAHFCQSIDTINPRELFALGELDVLLASPECMSHSKARGGRPVNDQSRATAWCVTRWAEALQPSVILVENVEEFQEWGPIGTNGKPLKSRRGDTFRAWCDALRSLGYRVDHRILCAADYGDPTTRRRLFVQAVRGKRKIRWPEATHFPVEENLLGALPWVPAREVINWEHPTKSIFERERPLSPNTLRRIEIGLRRYGLKPFMVPQQSRNETASIDRPFHTVTSRGAEALVEPFLVQVNYGNDARPNRVSSIDEPLKTVVGTAKQGLCQPWIQRVGHYGKDGEGAANLRGVDMPLSTVTTKQEHAVVQPFLVRLRGTSDSQIKSAGSQSVDAPLPTLTAGGGHVGLCEPFLTPFYGSSGATSINDPLDTVTTKERFGLVQPRIVIDSEEYLLDIHFRMLQPDELARAQGFPEDYSFVGNKGEITKQIGNAVPVNLARALVLAVLEQ